MKSLFKWFVIGFLLVVVVPVVWVSVQDYFSGYSWHQKLTIEVETPSGLKVGSSVVSMRVGLTSFIPGQPGGRGTIRLRGEATVVEVAPGRYLFALLKNQDGLAQKVFKSDIPRFNRTFDNTFGPLSKLREARSVPADLIPLLVTFADINNPKSVRKVEPSKLSASFGAGFKLLSVTLEITDEPVTEGRIESALAWMDDNKKIDAIWDELSFEEKITILRLREPFRRK